MLDIGGENQREVKVGAGGVERAQILPGESGGREGRSRVSAGGSRGFDSCSGYLELFFKSAAIETSRLFLTSD